MNTQNKDQIETIQSANALKAYQKIDESTGEVMNIGVTRRYKYLEGHPRQYRFDAKEGVFNINGTEKLGRTLTFQPIAWRIFTDNILNMGTKNWAEIFFIDDKNCVSAILFHGYSVDNIFRLIEPLYYDDLTLADVVITAVAEKKENNKIQPKGVYYIATFSYKMGDVEKTNELKQFSQEVKIFRQETLTDIANIKTAMNYYNPFANLTEEPELLSTGQL
ncbi:hypothetical protein GCM10028806_44430 [Spirosoma terrae]|uniref:Uncharacterized protein n=1 Tax=Spirosoma terrae TaxID=1968276 RepID=A0A6L9LAM7_9BACT|nr:hypothetical protein [Spirosoma terrae]NDU93889.1 hypothetical protein [Spirosoma terrae]